LRDTLGIETYLDFRAEHDIARDGAPRALLARGVSWQRHPFDISDAEFKALASPAPEDWRALYTRGFQRLRREVAGAIRLIAHAEAPLVFGCWAGKDRTGMVAALTLSLLGVGDQWIAADFAQTGPSLLPAKARFAFLWKDQPNTEAALVQAHLRTEPESILGFLSDVRQQFGAVSRALELPDSTQVALLERYVGVG
jgi:protein-tyrosine phosphatase